MVIHDPDGEVPPTPLNRDRAHVLARLPAIGSVLLCPSGSDRPCPDPLPDRFSDPDPALDRLSLAIPPPSRGRKVDVSVGDALDRSLE